MSPIRQILVFSSTADVAADNFVVPILAEPLDQLLDRAAALGFDGLEFLPNPDDIPSAERLQRLAGAAGTAIGVVNSGRMAVRGYALLHADPDRRQASVAIYKRFIDLAAQLGARVGLGMARGDSRVSVAGPDLPGVMRDVFGEIAAHAERAGTVVMLEPADPGYVAAILRVSEAAEQARLLASPGFSIMLDTYQLDQVEDSYEEGFAAAGGLASHIHLYDPQHWPPGVGPDRMDWKRIRQAMERYGFSGSGSMVLAPDGDRDAAARQSIAFVRKALMTEGADAD
jgi:D-psicose/D-tagatose/L-ribulose 3-epimerase